MSDAEPRIQHVTVPAEAAGARLDRFLADTVEGTSRSALQRLIAEGQVHIGGAVVQGKQRLKGGEVVEIHFPPTRPTELVPTPMDLEVLFEDPHLLVIFKPAGLVVHPAASVQEATLVHGLLAHADDFAGIGGEERPGIVHRLDRGTSGVMVVAKGEEAHRGLVELFKVHDIERRYVAIVRGEPRQPSGTWTSEIGRNPSNRLKMASVARGGRRAVTHYRVLASWPGASLLELTLETGRTHQIRVHTSEAGLPVLGDPVYGHHQGRGLPRDGALEAALAALDHQLLHARVLGFVHPVTGVSLRFERPPPEDFLTIQAHFERLARGGG